MSEVLKIYVLNGPNLNLLGEREPDIYGNLCLEDIDKMLKEYAEKNNASINFKQSNHEGELIDFIHEASKKAEAIIINPAGYTHTSVAIHDALKILKIPIIELHITNIHKREEFRHKSLISGLATGIICGMGTEGYTLALKASINLLKNENR